ncbi:ankyrin repeat domain-containing protein EMB506, chloroplastic isoform X2 [Apium graveolens]|uniref:ankyrin repeat domain-containing protein EMB506, chloroplastic isoform X2 n=1 Tax=Apium graveolens TaxID=4045 RepID=UPI003D7B61F4
MASTLVTTSLFSSRMFPATAVVVRGGCSTSCRTLNLFDIWRHARVPLRGPISNFPVAAKTREFLVCATFSANLNELWEDPNQVSDSEDEVEVEDEDAEVVENDLGFESDWEADKGVVQIPNRIAEMSASNYEEDLIKEVEQLLEPEEKAILHHNKSPDLKKISSSKWNSLHTLALAGQIPYMDLLLKEGFGIDLVDKDGLTALHQAIIGKKEAVISHLLRKGANPHARDLDGATPLHYAVQVGAIQTVKLLIKNMVDVNVTDNDGKTPLDLSICYGKDFKSYDLAKLVKLVPYNG